MLSRWGRRRTVFFGAVAALALFAALLAILYILGNRLHQPLPIPAQGVYYRLEPGTSLSQLGAELARQGLLPEPKLMLAYARLRRLDRRIHAGEYYFPPGTSAYSLLEALSRGRVLERQVTLVEGWRFHHALQALHSAGLRPLLAGLGTQELLRRLDLADYPSPEGLFFPDTYYFRYGDADVDVLRTARRRMQQVLAAAWEERTPGLPYQSAYDALILASIVEKETGLAQERSQVAGVFVQRLRKGMRLEADPSVIYGLGSGFDGNLRRRHLEDLKNPYNTYRIPGLPPTPIALPGRAAIGAALQPAEGDSLYFVARRDGSHVFSPTLKAHRAAVRRYQKRRVDSTPPQ